MIDPDRDDGAARAQRPPKPCCQRTAGGWCMLDEGHAEHGAHLGIVTTTVAERAEAVSVTRTKIFATYDRGVAR